MVQLQTQTWCSYIPNFYLIFIYSVMHVVFVGLCVPSIVAGPSSSGLAAANYVASSAKTLRLWDFSSTATLLLVEHFLFAMGFTCLVLTNRTDPGVVPETWPWNPHALPSDGGKHLVVKPDFFGVEKKHGKHRGQPRFCRVCQLFKPDRAHHSFEAQCCILELDHYCPWIRNVVGYYNHKYFFLLLLYGTAIINLFLATTFENFRDSLWIFYGTGRDVPSDIAIVTVWILAAISAFFVNGFFLFHVYLKSNGLTTVEWRKGHHNFFNVGFFGNWEHILGPNPLLWFIPTTHGMFIDAKGERLDGTRFRNNVSKGGGKLAV